MSQNRSSPAPHGSRPPLRPWHGTLAAGLLLAGCGQPAPSTGTPGAPVLIRGGTALVRGAVDSPFFDELRKSVTVVTYDGSQQAGEYDLVIVDGDAHAPEALGSDKLVHDAFHAGKWVLGVDLGPEHKRAGVRSLIHVTSQKPALAMMFRKDPRDDGRTVYRVLEVKAPAQPTASAPSVEPSALAQASAFARAAVTALGRGNTVGARAGAQAADCTSAPAPNAAVGAGLTVGAPQPDQEFPPTLVHFSVAYCDLTQASALLPPSALNPNFQQTASVVNNTTFTVALNNDNKALGDYQFLMVQNDTTATPAVNGFANQSRGEQAWFQDQITHDVFPSLGVADNPPFSWVSDDPSAPNTTTTYTSSAGFTVGFQGLAGTGKFLWENSTTYSIPDWKISSVFDGGTNHVSWNYRSGNPDADQSHMGTAWFLTARTKDSYNIPVAPNTLSTTQNIFHSAITYKTGALETRDAYFDVRGQVRLWDHWCTPPGAGGCNGAAQATSHPLVSWETYGVKLSAVVPDPVTSVTFDRNPARPGETVTGTVTLQRPAPVDTRVYLSTGSLNGNAVIQQSVVVVPQGQTSATFTVLTNGNGLSPKPGAQVSVPIVTFNVQGFTAQLILENPKLAVPTFSPSTVLAGTTTVGTVSVGSDVPADTEVTLASDSAFVTVPAKVTIPAETSGATFTVRTGGDGLAAGATQQATVTATLDTRTASAGLTVTNPVVQGITFDPGTVSGGATSTGTVTLTAPAAVDTVLPLTVIVPEGQVGTPNVSVPATVTIPKGQTSATFPAQTNTYRLAAGASTNVTVSSVYAQTFSGQLTVVNPRIQSFSFNPASVTAGTATAGTVTMDRAVGFDTPIYLDLTAGTGATVPESVTIPAGRTSASFSVPTSAVGDVKPQQMTASYASQVVTAQFGITSSTAFDDIRIISVDTHGTYTGTVELNRTAPIDIPVVLQASDPNAQITVVGNDSGSSEIPTGQQRLLFKLVPSSNTPVTVTATSPALPGQSVEVQTPTTAP